MVAKLFFGLLEKLGLCKVYVDMFGRVIVYRYYLFGLEPDEKDVDTGKEKPRWMPNVWIHRLPYLEYGPDGGNYHTHPWATVSIIVSGGYEENTLGKGKKWRSPGNVIFRSAESSHFLGKTAPNTTSIFAHWFRSKSWDFKLGECTKLCELCVNTNGGKCFKAGVDVMGYNDYYTQMGEKRTPQWHIYDEKAKKLIARKQEVVRRSGISLPTQEEYEEMIRTSSRLAIQKGKENAQV